MDFQNLLSYSVYHFFLIIRFIAQYMAQMVLTSFFEEITRSMMINILVVKYYDFPIVILTKLVYID